MEPTTTIVTLHQDDRRVIGSHPYLDIGLAILKINNITEDNFDISSTIKWDIVSSTGCSVERQISCEVNLLPGNIYLVVPCTTGGKFLQQQRYNDFYYFMSSQFEL